MQLVAVPPPRNIRQVSASRLAVAQRPSKPSHLDFDAALVDKNVGPDAGHELALADQFARAVDKSDQYLKRPAAKPNRRLTFQQQLLRRKEAERAERNRTLGRGDSSVGHFETTLYWGAGVLRNSSINVRAVLRSTVSKPSVNRL